MKIMLAYDGSRNAKLALAQTLTLFRENSPTLYLVGVAENPRDSTDANEDLFMEEVKELEVALDEGVTIARNEGFCAEVKLAEGDARKMLLEASKRLNVDLLVIARHSHQPDGGFIAKSFHYIVDEIDYMTFGSVSSFLARRAECPLLILPS